MIYDIQPVPKPRMTQRDKWAKRPAVLRYRAFCDQVRAQGVELPDAGAHITFMLPMPGSWSRKKRQLMLGAPHKQKPDVDNLAKALLDACRDEDQGVWDLRTTKRWAHLGGIEITVGEVQ
jgi:Holliday junction resolvase RusA-like endonuclease